MVNMNRGKGRRPVRKILKAALAATVAVCALAAPADAQTIDRVFAFGDSYADIGNLKAVLGPLFPSNIYPTGRFSGGTNFVDTLSAYYKAPIVNFAFGGAQAGNTNVTGVGLPGFQQEYQAFVAQGGSFNANDLVAISVGGNDARAYRLSGGTLAGVDAATTLTAQNATQGIATLAAHGAKHMVFIAGDAGQLPEALGQANAAIGTAFSNAYNAKMQATLAPIAHLGTQIAYVDITAIGNIVRGNPARFGFINVTTACPLTCLGSPATQAQYFFYVDGIHLTSAAFDLVGRYAINQLAAPYSFRAQGDLPMHAAQDFARAMDGRLDLSRGTHGPDGLSAYVQYVGGHDRYDADATADGYAYNAHGASGGVEWRRGALTAGGLFMWTRSRSEAAFDDRAKATSYQIGGYTSFDTGSAFAEGYAGYGWHNLDIRRTGVADPLTASPHARSWVAGGRAGWLGDFGRGRAGPVVGLAYAHSRLDGYTESGDAAAGLIVGDQRVDTLIASAGLELRPNLTPTIAPWLRVTADKSVHGDGRIVDYAPLVAPGIINSFEIASASRRAYGNLAGGLSARLGDRISLEGTVHSTFARHEGNEVGGFAGLRLAI